MIALLIGLTIALAAAFAAALARNHPLPLTGRLIQSGALLVGMLAVCTGLSLFPASQAWQDDYSANTAALKARYELQHTEQMIQALGSSRAYIEYLKATRAE